MADHKKDLSPNDKKFTNSLSFDDLNFDDLDLETTSKGPISDFTAGLTSELKNPSNSILFFRRIFRLGLPEGYLAAADIATDTYRNARSIASAVRQKSNDDINAIAESMESSLPKFKEKTPARLYAQLEKAVNSLKEKKGSARIDLNGNVAQEDQDVNELLARTFTGTQTATAQMLDQGAERRFTQDRLERRVRDKVDAVKSQRLINEIRASNSYLKNLNAFNDQYQARWMRSNLEIQYRTFQAIRDIRTLSERSYRAQIEGFKSLIHNSALPEFMKQNAGKYRQHRGTQRPGITDFHFGFGDQFRRNLMAGTESGAREGLAGIAQMLSMGMGDMGMSKSNMAGSMFGSALAGGANMFLAPFLASMMRPHARRLSNRTGGLDHWLQAMIRSAPGLMQQHANNWGATGVNGILHRLASRFAPRFMRDPYLTQSGFQNSDQAAQFNQMTQRSIVEVIPGYMSKILQEVRRIRTGSNDVPLEVYNFSKGQFSTQKQAQKDLVDRIVTPQSKDALRWTAQDALRTMDQDGRLSKDARTALAKQLTRDAAANRNFDPSRYANSETYSRESDSVKSELAQHFKRRYEFDSEGKLKRGLSNNRRLDHDTQALQGFNYAMPRTDNEIRRILDSGRQEDLLQLGVIRHENGMEIIDTERLFDLMIDHDFGNGGGESGPGAGGPDGGDPFGPNGELRIPLYTRRSRTPCMTPKQFNEGAYINKRTGQRIHSVQELEDTIVDQTGRVVVSIADLRIGLRDASGKIVYRYNGMFGNHAQNLNRRINRAARSANRRVRDIRNNGLDSVREQAGEMAEHVRSAASNAQHRLSDSEVAQRLYGKGQAAYRRLLEYKNDPSLLEEDRKRIAESVKTQTQRLSSSVDKGAGAMRQRWKSVRRQLGAYTPESLAKAVFGEQAGERLNDYRSNPELMLEDLKSVRGRVDELKDHLTDHMDVTERAVQIKEKAWRTVEGKLKELNISIHPQEIAGRLYGHGADSVKALERYRQDPEALLEDAKRLAERSKEVATNTRDRVVNAARDLHQPSEPQVYRPDIYVKGREEPVIRAADFTAGVLFDAETGSPIRSANDIKGPVVDDQGRYCLSKGDIEEGLVDHKGNTLEGIAKASSSGHHAAHIPGPVQEYVNRYKAIRDNIHTAKRIGNKLFGKRPPCDVYVKGNNEPALRATIMREGGYFDSKTGRVLESPDDIRGPIIDYDNNIVLSKEDLPHMEDAQGRRIRIPNIVIRAIRKVAGGYWKFTKAYYRKLWHGIKGIPDWAKRNPKTAAAMGGMMFGGPQGALMMAGLGKLLGLGGKDKEGNDKPSVLSRMAGGYGRMTSEYYKKLPKGMQGLGSWFADHPKLSMGALGALTGNPLLALGGIGLGGVMGRRRNARSLARRTAAFLNSKPGKIKITSEEAEDPILFTLTNINNQLALKNGEYNRAGAWDSLMDRFRGSDDDDDSSTHRGRGRRKSGKIRKAVDFVKRLKNGRGTAAEAETAAARTAGSTTSAATRAAGGLAETAAGATAAGGATGLASTLAGGGAVAAEGAGAAAAAGGALIEGGAAAATAGAGLAAGEAVAGGAAVAGIGLGTLGIGLLVIGGVALGTWAGIKGYHAIAEAYRDHIWRFRMAQYGVFGDDDMCDTVQSFEAMLQKDYPNGQVDYQKVVESGRFFDTFRILPDQPRLQGNALTWLRRRFMPIYQRSLGAIQTVNKAVPLPEANDRLSDEEKARYFKLVYFPMFGDTPYNCLASPFTRPLPANTAIIEEQYKAGLAQLDEDDLRNAVYSTEKVKDVETANDGKEIDAKKAAQSLLDIKDGRDPETGQIKVMPLKSEHAIHAPDKLTPLQQVRYYAYGLYDQARAPVEDILAFEREAITMIKTDGKRLIIDIQTWKLRKLAFKIFGEPNRGGSTSFDGYDNWIQYKFLPVLTEWAKGLYALNPQINLLDGDKGITYANQFRVAKMIYGIRLDWWFSTPSIWDLDYSVFGRYSGGCRKRAEAVLRQLEQKAARMPQGTELPTTEATPERQGVAANPTPKDTSVKDSRGELLKPGAAHKNNDFSVQNLVGLGGDHTKDTVTTAKKPLFMQQGAGGTSTSVETNPVNDTFSADSPTYQGGVGAGGLIDDIPMPSKDGDLHAATPMLQKIASMTGVDVNLMASIMQSESGLQAHAYAGNSDPTQTAAGLGQFTKDTWFDTLNKYADKYGLQKLKTPNDALRDNRRFDPRINGVLAAELIKDNADWFKQNIGRNPTAGEVYMVHFLGRAGAKKFFTTPKDRAFASVFPTAAKANKRICFKDKECRVPRSMDEVFQLMTSKVTGFAAKTHIGPMSKAMEAAVEEGSPTANQSAGTFFTDRLDTSAPKAPTINQQVASVRTPVLTQPGVRSAPSSTTPDQPASRTVNPAPVVAVDPPRVDVQQKRQAERQEAHTAAATSYYEESLATQRDMASSLRSIEKLLSDDRKLTQNDPQSRSTLSAGQMAPAIDTRIKR